MLHAILCRAANIRAAIGVIALSSLYASAFASTPPMIFEHLTRDDGLSQSNVLAITQDPDGFMWFATEDGLNRYDGYEFRHFSREQGNPDTLQSGFVFDVVVSSERELWLATDGGGVARLDPMTGETVSFRHNASDAASLASDRVRRVAIDGSGAVWAALLDGGLDRIDPATGEVLHVDLGLDAEQLGSLYSLYVDRKGLLWVGGNHGLSAVDTRTLKTVHFTHNPEEAASLTEGSVRAIAQDASGNLWVGTYGGGLSKMVQGSARFTHLRHSDDVSSLSDDRVTSILLDPSDRLWVGTTEGLNLIDTENNVATRVVKDPADRYSLVDDTISSLFADRTGLLWVGTKTRGLSRWNPSTWALGYEPAETLTAAQNESPTVTSFASSSDGRVWVGTFGNGLGVVDRATDAVAPLSVEAGTPLAAKHVMSLLHDSTGHLWVGTLRNGLAVLDVAGGNVTAYRHDAENPASLAADGIMSLYEDRAGRIWVGTFGGGASVFTPSEGTFKTYTANPAEPGALQNGQVTAFAEDPSGSMWIGTNGGGLALLDPDTGHFTTFKNNPSDPTTLSDNTVYDIRVDQDGTVWVGTRGGGLDRVTGDLRSPDSVEFVNLSRIDGLGNDTIYGIESDAEGWMWLSTNYGITRYHPTSGEFKVLHKRDGLQSEEFNFGAHHTSATGELFFGGNQGFNAFAPNKVRSAGIAPLIALTGFYKGNDGVRSDLPVDENGDVQVDWRQNDVSFEFAALDFVDPARNQYRYKLEGYDRDWIELGTQRRVTYTNLGGGSYELKVQAANSDGVWNEAGLSVSLKVVTAPWLTPMAFGAYAALLALLMIGLMWMHRTRVQREASYSRRLEHEVEARTEKLVKNNKALATLNRALEESSLSDPLTGLRNRRYVFQEVSRELALVQQRFNNAHEDGTTPPTSELVFMMIDLDSFKPINDTFGHSAGDRMLTVLRDVLLGICRKSDVVVRWGGDEFVVIARQNSPEQTAALAERIRSAIREQRFVLGEGQIARTTCSIGYVAYPLFRAKADQGGLDQIISMADGLMYEAKQKKDAWVGLYRPDEAITSDNIDHEAIQSSSLLYRAHRAKKLYTYDPDRKGGMRPGKLSVVPADGGAS
ncbi:MAG: two-component regulator propeller domain-containing protein [Pseudomonadota bacterium]